MTTPAHSPQVFSDPDLLTLNLLLPIFERQQETIDQLLRFQTHTTWAVLLLFALVIVLCLGLWRDTRRADKKP